jgi:hypothetical protein
MIFFEKRFAVTKKAVSLRPQNLVTDFGEDRSSLSFIFGF